MTRIAAHTVTARVIVGDYTADLAVEGANVILDDSWAPYVQGALVCALPSTTVIDATDPRNDARLSIMFDERVEEGGTIGDFDEDWGAGTLGTLFTSGTLDDINAEYAHPWNSAGDGVTGSRLALDVGIRSRQINHVAGTLTISFASDEALLQDYALMQSSSVGPGSTSVKDAALFALSKINATLSTDSLDALVTNADSLLWLPGVSGWAWLDTLTQATGLRLWCDESRVWRLSYRDGMQGTPVTLTEFTAAADTVNRDGEWYDGAVVVYDWTDDSDVRHIKRDIAGGQSASRTLRVDHATAYPGPGAAQRILDRSTRRGRVLDLTAVSRYDVRPSCPLTALPPNTVTQTGVVERVSFAWPEDEMQVMSRGLSDTDGSAWSLIPAGERWLDSPVGASWKTEPIGV